MLQIQNIKKTYVTGDLKQTALNGVNLTLRENEFVAILGPSGSGKTTLLNVIGGLDRYDSGDLIINGISTKKYTDRDWDSYRNHTIGFVFQSYNLIPHQTVLANVELALTISGISPAERKKRAVKALEDVGLGNQLHKKPNQMSGGQMQRVAIARALVNNPSILLADEPTGALDSETSIQVMELLKEVSRDRLVVMVTHNPELAYAYANRIVRVKDGGIVDDSNPYKPDEAEQPTPVHRNLGKASMSLWTALTLSFNNLWTKKGRTLLTAFAGSIGIIGIALILSLSAGFQSYIDSIQENTLANYPLTIMSETADMTSMMAGFMSGPDQREPLPPGQVEEQEIISKMFAQIGMNDLASFKAYLEENAEQVQDAVNTVQYSYGITPQIYADDPSEPFQVNPATLFQKITGLDSLSTYMNTDAFMEITDHQQLLDSQYELLDGRWPEDYHELVFILPSPDRLPDDVAYSIGLKDMSEVDRMMEQAMNGEEITGPAELEQWSYQDLLDLTFRLVSVPDLYRYNEEYRVWEDLSANEDHMKTVLENGELLRVVGIVCPRDGAGAMPSGIGYMPSLTRHVIEQASQSLIVKMQLQDRTKDVFNGKKFSELNAPLDFKLEDIITVDEEAISSAFGMDIDEQAVISILEDYLGDVLNSMDVDTSAAQADFIEVLSDLSHQIFENFLTANAGEDGSAMLYLSDAEPLTDAFLATDFAQERINWLAQTYQQDADSFAQVYRPMLIGLLSGYVAESVAQDNPEQPTPSPAEPSEVSEPVPTETEPVDTTPETEPVPSEPADTVAPTAPSELPEDPTVPEQTLPPMPEEIGAPVTAESAEAVIDRYLDSPVVTGSAAVMGQMMMRSTIEANLRYQISRFDDILLGYAGNSFRVDEEQLSGAFQFKMSEEDLMLLMQTLSSRKNETSANANLKRLGYADLDKPSMMSVYMTDFEGKNQFITFLDQYNQEMADAGQEEQVIHYTDMTGMMMESVRIIIDSVSYVLIAFVAVSLIVSSIMIGIITYISVMERTKEIGILRAIGASKHNISQVFNAETFIIGLCSGLIGIGITLLLLGPGNRLLFSLTGNPNIRAKLPLVGSVILIVLSMCLTLLGGLIPSKQASRKDPVIALRSE